MFHQGPNERQLVAEAERQRRRPVAGRFTFRLPGGSDAVEVARHLDGSAARARGGYAAGQHHEPTQAVIDVLQAIADAAEDDQPSVDVVLDQWGAQRVHGVLKASAERATESDVRNAVEAVLRQWDQFSAYRPEAEIIDASRPPRVAADDGGWLPVGV